MTRSIKPTMALPVGSLGLTVLLLARVPLCLAGGASCYVDAARRDEEWQARRH